MLSMFRCLQNMLNYSVSLCSVVQMLRTIIAKGISAGMLVTLLTSFLMLSIH